MITVYGIETYSPTKESTFIKGWNDMITVYGIETGIFHFLYNSFQQLERYDYRLRYWDHWLYGTQRPGRRWNDMITVYGIETAQYGIFTGL